MGALPERCRVQVCASELQLASTSEVPISGLPECTLVTRVAAAVIGGRPYAVAAVAAGGPEGGPEGDQQVLFSQIESWHTEDWAGLTMHWVLLFTCLCPDDLLQPALVASARLI